jgi:DNA-directed RNA polymerase I subunit RPA2
LAINRPSFANIGPNYTAHATMVRCGRKDQTTHSVTVHYLNNGQVNVRFILGKSEFFLPAVLMLKALCDTTDREIYEKIISGSCTAATGQAEVASYLLDAAEVLLQTFHSNPEYSQVYSQQQALAFIGNRFRVVMKQANSRMTDAQVGQFLLSKYIYVHLASGQDKFNLLMYVVETL